MPGWTWQGHPLFSGPGCLLSLPVWWPRCPGHYVNDEPCVAGGGGGGL